MWAFYGRKAFLKNFEWPVNIGNVRYKTVFHIGNRVKFKHPAQKNRPFFIWG
jgi:hypothetical protein